MTSAAQSASANDTAWWSKIRPPNCSRWSAQSVPSSISLSHAPTQRAAMWTRSSMNHSPVSSKPRPRSPRMFSRGTGVFVNVNSGCRYGKLWV